MGVCTRLKPTATPVSTVTTTAIVQSRFQMVQKRSLRVRGEMYSSSAASIDTPDPSLAFIGEYTFCYLERLAKPLRWGATLVGMGRELVSDELWEAIEPLLPPEPPKPKGGRPRISDRAALAGIVFVLKSGIPWEMLPKEMGCGSGSTCWRRLRDWQEAGVWRELHRALLDRLGEVGKIDWSRASLDSASVGAKRGARRPERIRRIAANRARSATLW